MASGKGAVKTAPIVAELGRPETPEEFAQRKSASSRLRRENQTPINLALSLGASLLIVAFLVVVVVRPAPTTSPTVDYAEVAREAQATVSEPLADPALPGQWTANRADISKGTDGIQVWYVGFISPTHQFIGMSQGFDANPTWVSNQLEGKSATGSAPIGGVTWALYDYRTAKDPGNLTYAMVATIANSDVVLFGSASTAEFRSLATAVAANLTKG